MILGTPIPLAQRKVTDPTVITDATIVMEGPHDLGHLEAAAHAVCRAHEALRTTVDLDLDRQLVHEFSPGAVGLRRHTAAPGRLMATVDERAKRPLDPAALPVFRVEVVVESPRLLAVHLAAPHAVADFTSMEIVVRHFVTCYRDLTAGEEARPPEVRRQFGDYRRRREAVLGDERTWLPGGIGARAADFWSARLAGAEPPAFGRVPPGGVQGDRMAFLRDRFDRDLLRRLEKVCGGARCSLFHAAIAAFEETVARLTGNDDVTTMCIVHGRGQPEFQDTVGMLTEEIAFRHRVRAPSRSAHLSALAVDAFATYVHQNVPLSAVADRSPEVARLYRRLHFRGMFLQYRPQRFGAGLESAVDGVTLDFPQDTRSMLASVMPGIALFNVDHAGDDLEVELIFDRRRWPAAEMARLHGGFLSCLASYALAPHEPVRIQSGMDGQPADSAASSESK
ncbi:condensation domain-containing protein [Actinomadura scrupuli]|uniref:condensation domain-containing protein n=1 Tax=Actinomadura scrupuli TaxID=559629 RepID=UPI003D97B9E2